MMLRPQIAALAALLAFTGCAKTSVVIGEGKVSVAMEAPSFYSEEKLFERVNRTAAKACSFFPKEVTFNDRTFILQPDGNFDMLVDNLGLAETVRDWFPKHLVKITIKCKSGSSGGR